MQTGLLIVLSGPSGTGKGTLVRELVSGNENLCVSVSCTTRRPRINEIEGENYFFKTHDQFQWMLKQNQFLEYAKVFDNYYGTPLPKVEELRNVGKDVILEIDVQGALKVKEKVQDAVLIFVVPPTLKDLKQRLMHRATETDDQINKRFATAYLELGYAKDYDYIVVNDIVEKAVRQIESILYVEKLRACRNDKIDSLLKEGEKQI